MGIAKRQPWHAPGLLVWARPGILNIHEIKQEKTIRTGKNMRQEAHSKEENGEGGG